MRHAIEAAPKDGTFVILEDGASATPDVAHWSHEAGKWVDKNGEPSKIQPTHWYPLPCDQYVLQENDGTSSPSRVGPPASHSRFAASSIAAALVAAVLVGVYFRSEVAAYVTRYGYAGQSNIVGVGSFGEHVAQTRLPSQGSRNASPLALQQRAEADQTYEQTVAEKAAQAKHAPEAPAPRQSFEKEHRTEVLADELAQARRAINRLNVQLRAGAANSAELLGQEREKATALAQEAAAARQELEEERARGTALASELATARLETERVLPIKARDDAAQFSQTPETTTAELEQERDSLWAQGANPLLWLEQDREQAAARVQEAAATRHELEVERARGTALASELAGTQREIETQAAQSQKAADAATKQKQEAEATIAELRQSLQHEQKKTAALMQEAKAAQATTTGAEQQRRALEEAQARAAALASELAGTQREIETQAAQSQKAADAATKQKQEAEATIAELRQSLQQEQQAETLSSEVRGMKALATLSRPKHEEDAQLEPVSAEARASVAIVAASDPLKAAAQVTQAVETVAAEQPAAAVSQGGPEVGRLMVRARGLLGQGSIGAARIVLERAAEIGSAQAIFTLAETYDPVVLSTWKTYGTRGDVTKAREFYAKAHAGGIQEAKNRLDALDQ